MKRGLDTNVLIYAQFAAFDEHKTVRRFLVTQLDDGIVLVVTPIVLHEFVHIVTDARRFDVPLTMDEALGAVRLFLERPNVECASVDEGAFLKALELMSRHGLGRNRIADTLFAATLLQNGVQEIVTCNPKDFRVFDQLDLLDPR